MKYKIRIGKQIYKGTAKEICEELKDTSMFERELPTKDYMRNFARRHNGFSLDKVDDTSYTAFVESLAKSVIVDDFAAWVDYTPKRLWLLNRFDSLNVGDTDLDKLDEMQLEDLVDELEILQQKGELNLETEQGLTKLAEVMDTYKQEKKE
jgi:hypothetical protein